MLLKTICKSTFCGLGCNCSYWKVQYLGHVEETRLWPGTLLSAKTSWSTFSRAIRATPALCSETQKPHGYSGKRKLEAGDELCQKKCCAFNLDFSLLFFPPLRSTKQLRKKAMNSFPVFLKVNNNKYTFVATPSLPLPFMHPVPSFCLPLPHLNYDIRDFPISTVFPSFPTLSSYWETPPFDRRCYWVNEG